MSYDFEPISGYVVVPRSTEKLPEDICLIFRYLLFKATWKERNSRNLDIGQVNTTIEQLVKSVKGVRLTEKQMRNRVYKMIKMGMVSYQPGRPNVPSVITVLNYAAMRNTGNYGNPEVTQGEPEGNPKGTRKASKENDLDLPREPEGNPKVTRREPEGKSYQLRTKNKEPESLHDSTTTLLSKMQEFVEIRKANFPNEDTRKYMPHKDDPEIVDELLKKFTENQILKNWEMFVLDPARVFYKSRPITLHLFKKAIYEEQAANKPVKRNPFKELREGMK